LENQLKRKELSVVMITHNEKKNLRRSLASASFADEIIVLDSFSTDGTATLAEQLGAQVHLRQFDGFSTMKNHAVSLATKEWILVLDADEEITPALQKAICGVLETDQSENSPYNAWAVPRLSSFLGKWIRHSSWFPDYTVRLFRQGTAEFNPVLVHESLTVEGKIGYLPQEAHFLHYTYETMYQYLEKLNNYTSLAARDMQAKNRKSHFYDILINPPFTFFRQYFLRSGFRDGVHGLVLALLSAFYVFVKYLKLRFPDRNIS
jgi:glycosyltransferase involved in cell wall biosynthesis